MDTEIFLLEVEKKFLKYNETIKFLYDVNYIFIFIIVFLFILLFFQIYYHIFHQNSLKSKDFNA